MQTQKRQSLPKSINNSRKNIVDPNSKVISIIPNIAAPNQILSKQILLSKPISHILSHNFQDILSESGTKQELYSRNQPNCKQDYFYGIFSLYKAQTLQQSNSIKTKVKINKLRRLKEFFLQEPQNIVFISRTVVLALNQSEKLLFKRILSNQNISSIQVSPQISEKYLQNLKRLAKILNQNAAFPFMCPQLNQVITEKCSFHNSPLNKSSDYLSFDDNFQSSNILMARKQDLTGSYCISTRFDYQTASYGQWFYFSVKRNVFTSEQHENANQSSNFTQNKKSYKLIICNMTKRYSMLGTQMKISVCRNGIWGKEGQNINYYETCFMRNNRKIDTQIKGETINCAKYHQVYFALEFQIQLSTNEEVFISYNEPYTVSKLSCLLDNFSRNYNQHQNLCKKTHQTFSQTNQTQLNPKKYGVGQKITHKNSKTHSQTQKCHQEQKIGHEKQKITHPQAYFKRQIICETFMKNQIECLSFSMKKQSKPGKIFNHDLSSDGVQNQGKKIIFILARAHPIETAGSYVLEGIMKNLFLFLEFKNDFSRRKQLKEYFQTQSKGQLFERLLNNFVIKVVPMINPDGVILGNSRCNFHGFDLNRQWKKSNKNLSLQIYHLKRFLLKYKGKIQMVIDLHGHSKKKNIFAYGMHDFRNPFSTRQFPYILSMLSQKNFLFQECRFTRLLDLKPSIQSSEKANKRQNAKQGTARIWLFRKLQIPNIFTIQNSYCGSAHSKYHYDHVSYGEVGKQILAGMGLYFLNYCSKEVKPNKSKKLYNQPKQFKEDKHISQFESSQILSFNDLTTFKDSIILDLRSRQQNITMGMDQINSSESEQQDRLGDSIRESGPVKKIISVSPSKSRSQKLLKRQIQSSMKKEGSFKKNRYATNQTQRQIQKTYNFNKKTPKSKHSGMTEQNQSQKGQISKSRIKVNQRFIPAEIRHKTKQTSIQKKEVWNYKSMSQLQKNVTLSIVQLGWDNSKIIEQKYSESDRIKNQFRNNNGLINFPHINYGNHIAIVNPSNLNLNSKINQKLKNKMNTDIQKIDVQSKKMQRKSSDSNLTEEIFKKLQQRKNVAEFMKKIQSNRKVQSEYATSRKIQKYKQIIMKINGGKNLYPI